MPQLFLFFSHQLTPEQQTDAEQRLGIDRFRALPAELQAQWSQVPAELDRVDAYAQPLWAWLAAEADPGDYVMVQGDFGLTYATVRKALELSLVPVYATTRRESSEAVTENGEVKKTLTFRHIRFRPYQPADPT
jgi:hypothetical protein